MSDFGQSVYIRLKVTLEASNRSKTMRNRKYAKFRIFPMVKKNVLAHLTKRLGDFGNKKLDFLEKSWISLGNPTFFQKNQVCFSQNHLTFLSDEQEKFS